MEYIVLRHISGSKATQEDKFSLSQFKEIILGRDISSTVSFDENTEAMVGRQHARITRNPALPYLFLITDLDSRNGTFVNQQRISGTVSLKPGDVVQCGNGGPVFMFYVEPETEMLGKALSPKPTLNLPEQPRPAGSNAPIAGAAAGTPAAAPAAAIDSSNKMGGGATKAAAGNRAQTPLIVGGGVLIGILALAGGFLVYRSFGSSGPSVSSKQGATPEPNAQPDVQPNSSAGKYGHVHLSGGDTSEAEKDAQRAAWRIQVEPYLALGAGHPGKAEADFDKPDGVAFSNTGLLYATDAGNRRVQIWDVKTGARLGEFGHKVFGGEIVDIAVTPDNTVLVTDQTLNLAYAFAPPQPGALDDKGKPLGPYDYQFKGTRFGEQGFKKLGGIAVDSKGRAYAVDAHRNDVVRFGPDGKHDKTWKFEKTRPDGDTYLHGCEGIAIDEAAGNLFIASEKDAVIEVFDWETGAYKHLFLGAGKDDADKPSGKHVFFGSVEGLAIAQGRMMAVDESAGHIQIFDLTRSGTFNTDLEGYGAPQLKRPTGYLGFIGHAPLVDFEDKTNVELQRQVKVGSIIPGQANPPGYFCSPDSIAAYTDQASGESYIAVADQCNYRLVVYRWSDVAKAMGAPVKTKVATNEARPADKPAPALVAKSAVAAVSNNAVPGRGRTNSVSDTKVTNAKITTARITDTRVPPARITPRARVTPARITSISSDKGVDKGAIVKSPAKSNTIANDNDPAAADGKKAKKAKKEKKMKY